MKPINEILNYPNLKVKEVGTDFLTGSITVKGVRCSVVATWVDEHVSIAPYNQTLPNWDMMCKLKDIFYDDEEEAYEIHPKKSEYVNIKKNCLHLFGRKGILER